MNTLLHNLIQALIALDCVANVLVSTLTLREGYATETLSAHCWRSYREGKLWGRLLMPPIDLMFSWQETDPLYVDESGAAITGHCRRAFEKEKARAYLPPAYR